MWLPKQLIEDVEDAGARVFYVSGAACRVWAESKAKGEPVVFTGFYWTAKNSAREFGPFRSRSSAIRDAWYRLVQQKAPPALSRRYDRFESERVLAENKARVRRLNQREARA